MDILIIEDDDVTINVLQHALKGLGHKTHIAKSGEEAIAILPTLNLDVLIADIMMAGISGLSLVTILRSVQNKTPIILMSSLDHKPLIDSALLAGANDFLSKPISNKDLTEKLKQFDNNMSF
jgi:CheY-like chemotaxis protein